jgi:hypothetical protein
MTVAGHFRLLTRVSIIKVPSGVTVERERADAFMMLSQTNISDQKDFCNRLLRELRP